MKYVEIYCAVGGKIWANNRIPQPDINKAHRQLTESRVDDYYHFMLVEEGTDLVTLPIPEGRP